MTHRQVEPSKSHCVLPPDSVRPSNHSLLAWTLNGTEPFGPDPEMHLSLYLTLCMQIVLLTSVEHFVCLKLNMCLSVMLDWGQRAQSCAGNIFNVIRLLKDISWLPFCSWCHIIAWLKDPHTTEGLTSYTTVLAKHGAYGVPQGWVLLVCKSCKGSVKTELTEALELMKV